MITLAVKELIESNALAFATVDEKGDPHCIAVGDVKVISGNQILVGDNYMRETLENIKRSPEVALTVWNAGWKENKCVGYEMEGHAEYFSSGEWRERIKKIHTGCPAKGAILITVEKVKKLA